MPPFLGITPPPNLPELVKSALQKARDSKHVLFTPTQVAILRVNDIAFQLRFAPSLAKKPLPAATTGPGSEQGSEQTATARTHPPLDPFADPIPPALFISNVVPHHRLVLNKFPVVSEHSILATAAFEPQDHLLAPRDLAAAQACVFAYRAAGRRLFAFFNSGPHSGASQPHRHVQLVPVDAMCEGLAGAGDGDSGSGAGGGGGWDVLADALTGQTSVPGATLADLPFKTFAKRLRGGMDAQELHELYLGLYRCACREIEALGGIQGNGYNSQTEGEARISYNLAMTEHVMVVCPRTAGEATMRLGGAGDGHVIRVSPNGTMLAGTALVKSQDEFDALRVEPGRLMALLGQIGVPNSISLH